jgi:hypothetical protein
VADQFSVIKGAPERQVACSKEAVLKMLLQESGLPGESILVVGDGKVEIALGAESGAYTLGVATDEENLRGMNPVKWKRLQAAGADAIIAAGLVNAEAAAKYILTRNPRSLSLVALGKGGLENAKEDTLCAKYIESLLTGETIMGEDALPRIFRTRLFTSDQIQLIADALLTDGGQEFFKPDPEWQEVYPREDFFLCTACDLFDFMIRIRRDEKGILYASLNKGLCEE